MRRLEPCRFVSSALRCMSLSLCLCLCPALDSGSSRLSQFLTREERRAMSAQQRSTWRAKQQDMKSRRRDFHGAVTYMFDGIFSWQMYGSADAVGSWRVAAIACHRTS